MSGKRENGKTPYYFQLKDSSPFAFAGLWERWDKGGGAGRVVHAPDVRGERCGRA